MPANITCQLVSLNGAREILPAPAKTVRRYNSEGHLDAARLGR